MSEQVDVPNLQHTAAVGARPDTQNVLAVAHTQNGTAHLVRRIAKLVANNRKQKVLPVPVGHALLQTHNPLAALAVLSVLPDRADALAEEVVVSH